GAPCAARRRPAPRSPRSRRSRRPRSRGARRRRPVARTGPPRPRRRRRGRAPSRARPPARGGGRTPLRSRDPRRSRPPPRRRTGAPPLPRRDPPSRSWTNGATSTTRSSRHRDRSGQGAVARRTARAGGGRFVIPLEDDLPAPRRAAMTARRAAGWLALAGIVALSFNLRPAAVSVGPLLAEVRDAV